QRMDCQMLMKVAKWRLEAVWEFWAIKTSWIRHFLLHRIPTNTLPTNKHKAWATCLKKTQLSAWPEVLVTFKKLTLCAASSPHQMTQCLMAYTVSCPDSISPLNYLSVLKSNAALLPC